MAKEMHHEMIPATPLVMAVVAAMMVAAQPRTPIVSTIDAQVMAAPALVTVAGQLAADGTHARGDASQIANWYGYGADVLAVADAVVVEAKDDLAEAPTLALANETRTRVPLENISGNFICLDLGGRFAFYEHLKHGSLRVKAGDRVTRGQVIAALGNSGGTPAGIRRDELPAPNVVINFPNPAAAPSSSRPH